MIQQKTVTIKDTDYLITHMPTTRGIKALKSIMKLIGPAFSSLQSGGIPAAIEALFDNIDAVDVEELIKGLVSTVSKGNMAINYDVEFAGEYDRLFLLIQEVVEFNFGSVFTLIGSDEQQ